MWLRPPLPSGEWWATRRTHVNANSLSHTRTCPIERIASLFNFFKSHSVVCVQRQVYYAVICVVFHLCMGGTGFAVKRPTGNVAKNLFAFIRKMSLKELLVSRLVRSQQHAHAQTDVCRRGKTVSLVLDKAISETQVAHPLRCIGTQLVCTFLLRHFGRLSHNSP